MMLRRSAVIGGTAAAGLAASLGRRAGAQELPLVRVGLAEGDDATPTLYAKKAGLFEKAGLNVEVVPMPSGAAGLAALAGGSVDVAGTSLLPFLAARARGLAMEIVAPLAISTKDVMYAAVLVKKDAPYRSGRDFAGKTIASPALRDLNWVATMTWIDRNGGDSSAVRSIELPGSAISPALADGRIDASTVTTPRYVQALHSGSVRVLANAYQAIGDRFLFAAFVALESYTRKDPAVIRRFGEVIRDAGRYANAHHAETMPLYAAFAKIDPVEIADAPRAQSAPYVEARDLEPILDVALRYKVLTAPVDPRSLISPAILKSGA